MSNKVNVMYIIKRHFESAIMAGNPRKVVWLEAALFIAFPIASAVLALYSGSFKSDSIPTSFITVCAVFAGLMLNLLVLVYDQSRANEKDIAALERKTPDPEPAENLEELTERKEQSPSEKNPIIYKKREVLSELIINISYSILASVLAIAACVLSTLVSGRISHIEIKDYTAAINYGEILVCIATALIISLLLTLMMIVKRVHRLLDKQHI